MTRRAPIARPLSMARSNPMARPNQPGRGGFSMIELLIVITIIAILAGFLLSAVNGGITRARVAQVVAEMKNLEQGIRQFEAEFGTQPPSFILLYERGAFLTSGNSWNQDSVPARESLRRSSRAIIKQIWPSFDFINMGDATTHSFDINGNGMIEAEPIALNGAECLVFFLGGREKIDTSTTPSTIFSTGFSKVPATPFAATTGSSAGPYYEFNSRQFIDMDSDGFQEYLDAIPGQSKPIQYFSSYAGQGYRPYGQDGNASTTTDNEILGSLQWIYTRNTGASATSPAEPYNPKTFQLISPGFDGEYGIGGTVDPETGVKDGTIYLPASHVPTTVVRAAPNTQYERDNITSFLSGELH